MESLSHPVARWKLTLTLPTGWTEISARLNINCEVKQITLKNPELGTKTGQLLLYDELGAKIFDGTAKAESATHVLIAAATYIKLAGVSTLTIVASGVQGTPKTFYVLIYGT